MGNQISSEAEDMTTVQNVLESNTRRRIHKREVSQPRRTPKSKIRLVPLSGSPSTSSHHNENPSNPFTTVSINSEVTNESQTMYHISPNQQRQVNQLSEEEQIKIAQRLGLIQHLPRSVWDKSQIENKKVLECCICMMDFEDEEPIRYLPCMHYYHMDCIDDWLMRSFTCPTCMEPVDAALLSSFSNSANIES